MTPQTAAGRRLLAAPWMLLPGQPLMDDMIADIETEAVEAERKRITLELSTHISRSTMPVFSHFDSWGVGQVVQGKPWPEGR